MYGCILGIDGDLIWVVCEGEYDILEKKYIYLKALSKNTELRLVKISKEELDSIKGDIKLIMERFQ